jgi:hypothetical protein
VTPTPAFTTDSRLAGRLSALASLGAAIIHFAVIPAHWQEWIPSGLFFISLALFQLVWAAMASSRLTTPVLISGIMINVGAIAIWAVSRVVGSPFGPHAGVAEVVQAADVCALLLQIYVVMGAGWVWHRGHHGEPIPAYATAIIVLGAGTVVGLASTVGVASGMQHGHHGPAVAELDHHSPGEGHQQHHDPAAVPVVAPVGPPAGPAPVVAPLPPAAPDHDGHGDHDH